MLSKKLKEVAEYYILAGITKEDVEFLTGMKFSDLPKEFHEYCNQVENDYNTYCEKMQQEISNNLNKI